MITVQIGDVRSLIDQLVEIPKGLEKYVINNLSQIAYDEAERGADTHTRTGALRQSLYNRAFQGGRSVGHDVNRAPYAAFVLLGTRPHRITPKNKKALRWPAGSRFAFSKSVNHPGYRGDNYLFAAADSAVRQLNRIVAEGLNDSARLP